ncbi:MAG TPA: GtrA family protein [Kofleriaceae bacterium]|nr:GtrA family protein [Kofleriaceae bacterium]
MITRTFARSIVTSIFSTAVDFATLLGLTQIVDYRIATAIGTIVGFLTNFTINRYWAFEAKEGALHWQFVRVLPVQAGSTLWQTLGMWLAVGSIGLHLTVAKIIVSAVVYLIWNYPMNRHFVFGGKPAQPVVTE